MSDSILKGLASHIVEEDQLDSLLNKGDTIVYKPADTVADGEAALITIGQTGPMARRLYREGDKIRVKPENPAFPEGVFDATGVRVLGRVVAVFRQI